MKLQAKLLVFVFSVLLVFGLGVGGAMRIVISSYGEDEMHRIRRNEMAKIRVQLKNYVDIAHAAIESTYRKHQEKDGGALRADIIVLVDGMRYGEDGYFWINDTGTPIPNMVAHPTVPELNGKRLDDPKFNCALGKEQNLFQAMVEVCEKDGYGYVDYLWPRPTADGLTAEQPKLSYVRSFEPMGWVIGTGAYLDAVDEGITQKSATLAATMRSLLIVIAGVSAVALLALVGVGYLVTDRLFIRKIHDAVRFAGTIADGDLSRSLEIQQKDEIGTLADSLNHMNGRLRETVAAIVDGVGVVTASSADLSAIADGMTGGASNMTAKAELVAAAAEEMSAGMNSVAAASEEAATNVKMVATAMEEMTVTVDDIARNAEGARSIAGEAVDQGSSASDKVNRLGQAAQEIGKVTEVITEISEQTNLLALNATIEAARAGEAGKGFAVVANEIKELARQTPEATQDIKNKIANIQASTAETVQEIGRIVGVIDKVNQMVSGIATAVQEQSAVTREIAANVANASMGIEEVNRNVAQSSSVAGDVACDISELNASVSEISEGIQNVNENAENLSRLAGQLKELSDRFKV